MKTTRPSTSTGNPQIVPDFTPETTIIVAVGILLMAVLMVIGAMTYESPVERCEEQGGVYLTRVGACVEEGTVIFGS